jgi:ribosomal protein L11 methylase PrmA
LSAITADPGSFRDPAGHVYQVDGRVFRTVTSKAVSDYEFLRNSDFILDITERGWFVGASEIDPSVLDDIGDEVRYVVEHPRIPFVSYPYEWPFPALKAAALLHLDLHLEALQHNVNLCDASAYNVQFLGARPVFIDLLSMRRYQDGEFWLGHRQFCEQFLNPLLLRACFGVPHNAWYRGNLEGITTNDLSRMLSLRQKLSWNMVSHVVLPARLQRTAIGKRSDNFEKLKQRRLPLNGFRGMLTQLRNWIAKLEPRDTGMTVWGDYEKTHSYSSDEAVAKRRFISSFISAVKPALLWDLGCNTGEYTETAINAGAEYVIGFDFDQKALETAFARANAKDLNFLPLYLDAANPSPDQGWHSAERGGLQKRAAADAMLALAFEHHLAIGRNIPLDKAVDWLVGLAPTGVIEFVQKDDPTVQEMLTLREDIFDDYNERNFSAILQQRARIIKSETVSATGRRLFWYDRA